MAIAIEKLTKLPNEKEAQIAKLMLRLESQNPLLEGNQENIRSSKAKDPEAQECQQKKDTHDRNSFSKYVG